MGPWKKSKNNAQCVNPRATRETLWRPTSAHACLQRCEKHVKWSNMLQHGLLYMAGILLASARPTNSPQLNPLGWGGHLVLSLRAGPRTEYAKLEVKGGAERTDGTKGPNILLRFCIFLQTRFFLHFICIRFAFCSLHIIFLHFPK